MSKHTLNGEDAVSALEAHTAQETPDTIDDVSKRLKLIHCESNSTSTNVEDDASNILRLRNHNNDDFAGTKLRIKKTIICQKKTTTTSGDHKNFIETTNAQDASPNLAWGTREAFDGTWDEKWVEHDYDNVSSVSSNGINKYHSKQGHLTGTNYDKNEKWVEKWTTDLNGQKIVKRTVCRYDDNQEKIIYQQHENKYINTHSTQTGDTYNNNFDKYNNTESREKDDKYDKYEKTSSSRNYPLRQQTIEIVGKSRDLRDPEGSSNWNEKMTTSHNRDNNVVSMKKDYQEHGKNSVKNVKMQVEFKEPIENMQQVEDNQVPVDKIIKKDIMQEMKDKTNGSINHVHTIYERNDDGTVKETIKKSGNGKVSYTSINESANGTENSPKHSVTVEKDVNMADNIITKTIVKEKSKPHMGNNVKERIQVVYKYRNMHDFENIDKIETINDENMDNEHDIICKKKVIDIERKNNDTGTISVERKECEKMMNDEKQYVTRYNSREEWNIEENGNKWGEKNGENYDNGEHYNEKWYENKYEKQSDVWVEKEDGKKHGKKNGSNTDGVTWTEVWNKDNDNEMYIEKSWQEEKEWGHNTWGEKIKVNNGNEEFKENWWQKNFTNGDEARESTKIVDEGCGNRTTCIEKHDRQSHEDGHVQSRTSIEKFGNNNASNETWVFKKGHDNNGNEWEEKWNDYPHQHVAVKSGKNPNGDEWRETWTEHKDDQGNIVATHAVKEGRNGPGTCWVEEWTENHEGKVAHKWCHTPSEEWDEKWGEEFHHDGSGEKWTSKWAKDTDGNTHGNSWGDKWGPNGCHGHHWGENWHNDSLHKWSHDTPGRPAGC